MDEQKQLINLFCVCGNQRENDPHHRLLKPGKIITSKRIAEYYHKHRDEINARSKINQQINKVRLARIEKTMNSYRIEIDEFNKKIQNLTQAMEMSKTAKSVSKLYHTNFGEAVKNDIVVEKKDYSRDLW